MWMTGKYPNGYGHFCYIGKTSSAHRASWLIHRGPIEPGLCVLHKCDNPGCVRPDHLFLGTNDDNVADRGAKNRTARGERHGSAKLTTENVAEIRAARAKNRSLPELAERFGVSKSLICQIAKGKVWKVK